MATITAGTDGSSIGGPGAGPAGWAWFVDKETWQSGAIPHGTNQAAELTAILKFLQAFPAATSLHVISDSQYAINSCTKWMPGWKKKGWVGSNGQTVKNLELMQALDVELSNGRQITFEWVRGHNGHPLNEVADILCTQASAGVRRDRSAVGPFGPGGR